MSKQAMTEILAAVANGEGAADTDTVPVSLGALRALVRQEPIGYMRLGAVDLLRGEKGRQLVWGINTFVYVRPNDDATAVYASPATVVAGQADEVKELRARVTELEGKQEGCRSYHVVAQRLYGILDDIDTAGDIAKADDALYRSIVEKTQAKKRDFLVSCDGYTVVLVDDSMLAAAKKQGGAE